AVRCIVVPTAPPTGLLMDRAFFTRESYRRSHEALPHRTAPQQQQQQQAQQQARPPPQPDAASSAGGDGDGSCASRGGGGSADVGGGGGGGGGGSCTSGRARGSSGSGGGWLAELEGLSCMGEAFKREALYPAIHDAGPLEMWLFLCGLTDVAFGFRTWGKRRVAGAQTNSTAASTAAAGDAATAAPARAAAVGAAPGGGGNGGPRGEREEPPDGRPAKRQQTDLGYLVEAPPNVCTPTHIAEAAAHIAARAPDVFTLKVYEKEECMAMGMGLFLGVAEASAEPPKFIHLKYTPKGGASRKIAI
ncbi:putative cytosol aminopeptidase, partial [Tetrabaena socialis]